MTILRNLNDIKYENISSDFYIKQKNFQHQYAPLYAERLTRMKKDVERSAVAKWSQKYQIKGLADLVQNEKCIIIGTLYKEMKNKPNILKELAEDESNNLPVQPVLSRDAKYIDVQTDQLILEDELQRIMLVDAPDSKSKIIAASRLCTGIVIALFGYENESSEFAVEDYCFKKVDFYCTYLPKQIADKKCDNYVVFLSGIELGDSNKTTDYLYKLQLLFDFLRGDFLGNVDDDTSNMVSNTVRLVIAGNSLSSSTQSKDMINKAKYLTKNYVAGSVNAIKLLDDYLLQLINHIEVDVMPGEFDPSNLMLPQQPLHHSMLSKSINSDHKYNLHTPTNPYRFCLNGICFLGTSGQFIDDIRRSTDCDDPIELMKLTLDICHLGPTCPDTLASYPYYGKDPFVLDNYPNVYFSGNQPHYKHDLYHVFNNKNEQAVHLISLPKFSATNSCVFLNLNTLTSEEVFF